MAIMSLSPYINFNGSAARAIAFYERVLDARTVNVTRAGDLPGNTVPKHEKDRILHAVLMLGESPLLLSDAQADVSTEGNVHVSLNFTDVDEMTRRFAALAEGGAVTVPLQNTFWGAKFGMLTGPFGVRWMFSCATPRADE